MPASASSEYSILFGCLFTEFVERVIVLAHEFRDLPIRLEPVDEPASPGLGIRFRVLNRDVDRQRITVDTPEAFHDVERIGVRMPESIETSLVVEVEGVHDQGVSLPLANRISQPCGSQILVMLAPIRIDLAHMMIELEDLQHPAGNLNDLHRAIQINRVDA